MAEGALEIALDAMDEAVHALNREHGVMRVSWVGFTRDDRLAVLRAAITSYNEKLAERVVDARKGSHQPTEYDRCPCCGYDGLFGDGSRQTAIEYVQDMLREGQHGDE